MNLPLHKIIETATTITLGWTPTGNRGYRFTREKANGKYSHTWDASRKSAKFSKDSAWYAVEAISGTAAGKYTAPVSPPQPVPPPSSSFGQRYIYMSEVTQAAIDRIDALCSGAPSGWYTVLFSADVNQSVPGGPYYVTDAQLNQIRNAGGIVASWCDGTSTPISAAKKLQLDRSLAFASGQFETVPQWNAMKQTVPLGIGNPAEFLGKPEMDELKAFPGPGHALIGEMLHPDPGYSAQGVNISSVCVYIDMDANQGGYNPLVNFEVIAAGFKPTASLYTGGRASDADLALYWQWTKP